MLLQENKLRYIQSRNQTPSCVLIDPFLTNQELELCPQAGIVCKQISGTLFQEHVCLIFLSVCRLHLYYIYTFGLIRTALFLEENFIATFLEQISLIDCKTFYQNYVKNSFNFVDRLVENGGLALLADYGGNGQSDSFRAFRKHKQVHPLVSQFQ